MNNVRSRNNNYNYNYTVTVSRHLLCTAELLFFSYANVHCLNVFAIA